MENLSSEPTTECRYPQKPSTSLHIAHLHLITSELYSEFLNNIFYLLDRLNDSIHMGNLQFLFQLWKLRFSQFFLNHKIQRLKVIFLNKILLGQEVIIILGVFQRSVFSRLDQKRSVTKPKTLVQLLRLSSAFSPLSEKLLRFRTRISLIRWLRLPIVKTWINNLLIFRLKFIDIFFVVGDFSLKFLNVRVEEIPLLWSHTVFLEKVIELSVNSVSSLLVCLLSPRSICRCYHVLCWIILAIGGCELVVGRIFSKGLKQVFHRVLSLKEFCAFLFSLVKLKIEPRKSLRLAFFKLL